jgi:hypothetical protein
MSATEQRLVSASATEAISYVGLYARWEKGNWSAMDIDFTQDKVDWWARSRFPPQL